jgi:energy-coupling factor transporter ATP-binding protein EcfA2
LLDEPAAGMNPSETSELMRNIRKIRDLFNVAIILIEHDMSLVMGSSDLIRVLSLPSVRAPRAADRSVAAMKSQDRFRKEFPWTSGFPAALRIP